MLRRCCASSGRTEERRDNGTVAGAGDSGERQSARREYAAAMVLGLVGAGSAALAGSRTWVVASATQRGIPPVEADVAGNDLHPLAGALAFVLLAAFGAVLATRGRPRRAIGLLVIAAAAVVLVLTLTPSSPDDLLRQGLAARGWAGATPYRVSWQLWRLVSALGAVLCLGAGWLVVRRADRWPAMGSRYDAPSGTAAAPVVTEPAEGSRGDTATEADMWRALDEGRDPTQQPAPPHVTMGPAKRERDRHQ
jgi:uncharacterized membrane protein (TIGR02234 family)